MVGRFFGSLATLALSWGALFSVPVAQAGDCHGGAYFGGFHRSCNFEHRIPGPGYLEMNAHEAYILFQKHPHLAKSNAALFAKLEAKFGQAPALIEAPKPVAVSPAPAPGIAPVIAPGGKGVPAPPALASRAVKGAVPVASPAPITAGAAPAISAAPASIGAPPGPAPVAAPVAGDSTSIAPPGAAPANPTADADPLNAGPDPALPPAAPPAAVEPSPVRPELEPLLGLWQTVTTDPNGEQRVTQVDLDSTGAATVTVDSTLGKVSIKRKFSIDDESKLFSLVGEGEPIVLGKVVSADKDQVVLDKDGATLTFTRP